MGCPRTHVPTAPTTLGGHAEQTHAQADSSFAFAPVVQRARKEADKAAGKLADEEKKKQEESEAPATPEIVVPPAPTDDEVEDAKKDYESKMKVLKDEVARLQGEKTKLFQLLKQQCAAEPFMRLRLVKSVRPCNCINARLLSLRFGCADKLPTRPRRHVPRL